VQRVDNDANALLNSVDFIWATTTVAVGDTAVLHCSFDAIFQQLRTGSVSFTSAPVDITRSSAIAQRPRDVKACQRKMKNLGKGNRGRSHGLPKIFRASKVCYTSNFSNLWQAFTSRGLCKQ